MNRESTPTPDWASWIQNWCGSWHLEATVADASQQLEIGMLVVKFPDDTLHPGVVLPTSGLMMAGGFTFQAQDNQGKKCLKVLPPNDPTLGFEVPTEGEVYEENDEIP